LIVAKTKIWEYLPGRTAHYVCASFSRDDGPYGKMFIAVLCAKMKNFSRSEN
jgi:hypothetical protein